METRTVFVSSENRDTALYPYGNNYTLHLNTPIKDIARVELLHATVPNSLFNLRNGTAVIGLSNTTTNTLSQASSDLTFFSIPLGFYGGTGIASAITNASSNLTGITVTYLANEGRFMLYRDVSYGPFGFYSNTSEFSSLLGFNTTGSVYMSSNVAVETDLDIPLYSDNQVYRNKEFIKSDKVANLAPNNGIFLDIQELRTQFNQDAKAITGNTTSGQSMSRSFGMIPMDVSSGEIKRFNKNTDYDMTVDYIYPIRKLDRFTVEWVDRDGQRVSFNGLEDNSFVLKIHTLRTNLL